MMGQFLRLFFFVVLSIGIILNVGDKSEREFDAPQEFHDYHREIRTREGQSAPEYPSNNKILELQKAGIAFDARTISKSKNSLNWIERGPANFSGRSRAVIADLDDGNDNTWFSGGVGGGIWKTTNAGASWSDLTPNLPTLAVTTMAQAASDHTILYAGTGEGFYNIGSIVGDGIFKSTDKGLSWIQLSSTAGQNNFSFVNRIIISPSDANIILAATNAGIFRSTNGGVTWTAGYSGGGLRIQHILYNPQNANTVYAAGSSGNGTDLGGTILRSLNGGVTWSPISTGITQGGRIELAIAPSDTTRLYAAQYVDESTSRLYMTTTAGATWGIVNETNGTNPNWFNGQGWYDNSLAVDPYAKDTVLVGGLNWNRVVIQPGSTNQNVRSADTVGTASFLKFESFAGIPFLNGGVGTGMNGFGGASSTNLAAADTVITIELRFGTGITQKGHRFSVGAGGSGIAAGNYIYSNYVDVPFQAWDITNNRQLMVSFRDEKNDGAFDLNASSRDVSGSTPVYREYIFVHAVTYNASAASGNISVAGGIKYKTVMEVGPALAAASWTPNSLPSSTITLRYDTVAVYTRITTKITNWFTGESQPFVHADQHGIYIIPKNASTRQFKILVSNDGGVAFSPDRGVSWNFDETTADGLNTTQFYGVSKKPGGDQYVAGSQDNGSLQSPNSAAANSAWTRRLGGDGFECVWNYADANKILLSLYYNEIWRSTNGGSSFSKLSPGISDQSDLNAPFITRLGYSQFGPDFITAIGRGGVSYSTNFGTTWSVSPIPVATWGSRPSSVSGLTTVSIANPWIVWAGQRMSSSGTIGKIFVSKDQAKTFTETNNYSTNLGSISGLATHPSQDSTAYVLFSFANYPKILRTTNLGSTWSDISGFGTNSTSNNGFPNVAVYSLLVMPHNNSEIWVGTEIGLFVSTNAGVSWSYSNNGLPAVSIWQMQIVDKQVVLATHGRGVWTVDIPQIPVRATVLATIPDTTVSVNFGKFFYRTMSQVFQAQDANPLTYIASVSSDGLKAVLSNDSLYFQSVTDRNGVYEIRLTANNGYANSVSFKINMPDPSAPVLTLGALSTSAANVIRFGIGANEGLMTPTLSVNLTSVSVQKYGKIWFGDYPWSGSGNLAVSLSAADSSGNVSNLSRNYSIAPLSKSLYVGSFIITGEGEGYILTNDLENYETPDNWQIAQTPIEIMSTGKNIRITMNASHQAYSVGLYELINNQWVEMEMRVRGGMISAIYHGNPVAAFSNSARTIPKVFALEQNYPNPFNPTTVIRYSVPATNRVALRIYNLLGQEIRTLVESTQEANFYEVVWDGKNNKGVSVAAGVYLYRLESGSTHFTKKMLLIK